MRKMKESRTVFLSVEGKNCEVLYFEHLQKLINACPDSRFKVKFVIKPQIGPKSMVKRIGHKPDDKDRSGKVIPYMHVQDVEDYNSAVHKEKFENLLLEIHEIEHEYILGYSNYTFELWLLLHVTDMKAGLGNRTQYLGLINRYFHRHFSSLDEYKSEGEFKKILGDYVTLDTVKMAIKRANAIRDENYELGRKRITKHEFTFYKDNPDTTVHSVVSKIFDICGIDY